MTATFPSSRPGMMLVWISAEEYREVLRHKRKAFNTASSFRQFCLHFGFFCHLEHLTRLRGSGSRVYRQNQVAAAAETVSSCLLLLEPGCPQCSSPYLDRRAPSPQSRFHTCFYSTLAVTNNRSSHLWTSDKTTMANRENVEFKTVDVSGNFIARSTAHLQRQGVTLRGWFYTSSSANGKAPCIVIAHGWTATKEFDLDDFAVVFAKAGMHALVYDHRCARPGKHTAIGLRGCFRGFGDSETGPNAPRLEIIPSQQLSDWSDAITYAQSRDQVNSKRIGIWVRPPSASQSLGLAY